MFWLFWQLVGVVAAVLVICLAVFSVRTGMAMIAQGAEIVEWPIRKLAEAFMVGMGALAKTYLAYIGRKIGKQKPRRTAASGPGLSSYPPQS